MAGVFGGRRIAAPRDTRVRPTSDRVREAWMSILSDELRGARVLDLFAGSGALGLEALSRGAVSADFVEMHRASLAALAANIEVLGVGDRAQVHRGDAERFVAGLVDGAFDVAFADPPYSIDYAARIAAHFHRAPFARILSIEHRADLALPGGETRRYGDTAITFFHAS
ncbi:MAG TPA: 16S rRNA (guanine(966)-N(2))-methyltransferase RsmD [Gemmatimonadales bacterium]|nr:16S rRNA (guanine(966)-N(2))-methyltransferase RsmD [Gemmatimonadales bacterium]